MLHITFLDKIDLDIFLKYENNGLIRKTKHNIHEIYIWNYTEKTQYNRSWDDITKKCRGLITDFDGNIIATSFPKFFNLEEYDMHNIDICNRKDFEVYDKLDGSLGILFTKLKNSGLGSKLISLGGKAWSTQRI